MTDIVPNIQFPFSIDFKKEKIEKKLIKILEINPNNLVICTPKQIETSRGIFKKESITFIVHRVNEEDCDWNILKLQGDNVSKMKL